MSTDYPVSIIADGVVRLEGIADFTDPSNAPSSYTPPITNETVSGGAQAILNGNSDTLPFDTHVAGDVLLDLTTPKLPTVHVAGVYAVTVLVNPTGPMTVGGYYQATLILNTAGPVSSIATVASPLATVAAAQPETSLTGVCYLAPDDDFLLSIANNDGMATIAFGVTQVMVQRLS